MKVYSIGAERNMTDLGSSCSYDILMKNLMSTNFSILLVFSICKVMGRQALEQGRLGSAVTWAIKSKVWFIDGSVLSLQ